MLFSGGKTAQSIVGAIGSDGRVCSHRAADPLVCAGLKEIVRCYYWGQPGYLRRDCHLEVTYRHKRPPRLPGNELDRHLSVHLTLSGERVTALVGTGASCILLQQAIYLKLAWVIHRTMYLCPSPNLQGVTGQKVVVAGKTELKTDCLQLHQQIILGTDVNRFTKTFIDNAMEMVAVT